MKYTCFFFIYLDSTNNIIKSKETSAIHISV